MLRIGIAASKMSKGRLFSYNLYVILIACLFSLFIFFICGFSILLIIFLVSLIMHALKPEDLRAGWMHMFEICLVILAIVLGIFTGVAIFKNLQFKKKKI